MAPWEFLCPAAVPSSNVQLSAAGEPDFSKCWHGPCWWNNGRRIFFTLPDIFHPHIPTQSPTAVMTSSKKEETKAFDFISDHLAAARDPKRVI
ncbi:hypothetical protein AAG906_023690 [Vitis piasezkii]